MNDDEMNPFEKYLEEMGGNTGSKPTPFKSNEEKRSEFVKQEKDDFLKSLEKALDGEVAKKTKKPPISEDAKVIKDSINKLIKVLVKTVERAVEYEQKRGTRLDLIVTLIVGGVSFVLATMFFLVNNKLKVKLSQEDYEKTFVGMFRSAVKDIRRTGNSSGDNV